MNIHDKRLNFKAFQKLSSDALTGDALEIGASGVEASEGSPLNARDLGCILEDPEKFATDEELLMILSQKQSQHDLVILRNDGP
jgi:hypothetical protein